MIRAQAQRRQELTWTPYIIGFTLVCLGPLRPLLKELVSFAWSRLVSASQEVEQEVAWYDQ